MSKRLRDIPDSCPIWDEGIKIIKDMVFDFKGGFNGLDSNVYVEKLEKLIAQIEGGRDINYDLRRTALDIAEAKEEFEDKFLEAEDDLYDCRNKISEKEEKISDLEYKIFELETEIDNLNNHIKDLE